MWHLILAIVALCFFVAGIFRLVERQWVPAILCFFAAAVIGPGGISWFT